MWWWTADCRADVIAARDRRTPHPQNGEETENQREGLRGSLSQRDRRTGERERDSQGETAGDRPIDGLRMSRMQTQTDGQTVRERDSQGQRETDRDMCVFLSPLPHDSLSVTRLV